MLKYTFLFLYIEETRTDEKIREKRRYIKKKVLSADAAKRLNPLGRKAFSVFIYFLSKI